MKKNLLSIVAVAVMFASCNKDKPTSSESVGFGSVESFDDLKVPASFNWSSTKEMTTDISVVGIEGIAKPQVRIDIYDKDPYQGGEILFSSFTNNQGKLEVPVKFKTSVKEVVVVANTLGVGGNRITASVTGNTLEAHFSGVPQQRAFDKNSAASYPATPATGFPNGDVFYLGGFNANGIPSGMGSDVITQAYLDDLALTLPEKNHIPCDPVRKHMLNDLFCSSVTTSKNDADVYVTFLDEGAGYHNTLAYYYYDAANPPASPAAIDSFFVIIPNATAHAALMQAGDKIHLGTFPKNTTIEWVLLGNMWDQTDGEVEYNWNGNANTSYFFFGNDDFNTDMGVNKVGCADANFQQHMLSFTDQINGKDVQLFSFEDIAYPGGDFDFNDCIFYASGDLIPSCAPQRGVLQGPVVDTDQDGIIDPYDDEPNNPEVACLIDFEGTLLFEDLWPSTGDFDFNDLIVGYDITHAIHATGYVNEVRADYTLKAAGAGFNNGFGVLLSDDLQKSDIAGISGRTSTGNFAMDGDLTATPGSDLVMYVWDRASDIVNRDISGGKFFNTVIGGGKGNFVTENVVIDFVANAVQPWELGLPPYNPFIFQDQDQSVEIHLADHKPSSLHNNALFGTAGDDSNPGIGRYYKNVNNLPWAIDIPKLNFLWALEKIDVLQAYLQLATWASSGGVLNTDWYEFAQAPKVYVF